MYSIILKAERPAREKMKECEVRGKVGRELTQCQEETLELCTVQSWRIKAGRQGGEGQQGQTAVARWSPVCFEVADCCWEQDSLQRWCVWMRGKDHQTQLEPQQDGNHCFLLVWTGLSLQLCCLFWSYSMQLKVRKIQYPLGSVPSGSCYLQRQVCTSLLCCSSQYRDTMKS